MPMREDVFPRYLAPIGAAMPPLSVVQKYEAYTLLTGL